MVKKKCDDNYNVEPF